MARMGLIIRQQTRLARTSALSADPANPAQDKMGNASAHLDTRAHRLEDFRRASSWFAPPLPRSGPDHAGGQDPVHSAQQQTYQVACPDAVYSLHVQGAKNTAGDTIRLPYESLNRPGGVRLCHIAMAKQRVLKRITGRRSFRFRSRGL